MVKLYYLIVEKFRKNFKNKHGRNNFDSERDVSSGKRGNYGEITECTKEISFSHG
ncbi:MAG: hypothetical protein ACI4D0_02125 [Lachnospira sp.]